jgi:hypothetical protein
MLARVLKQNLFCQFEKWRGKAGDLRRQRELITRVAVQGPPSSQHSSQALDTQSASHGWLFGTVHITPFVVTTLPQMRLHKSSQIAAWNTWCGAVEMVRLPPLHPTTLYCDLPTLPVS